MNKPLIPSDTHLLAEVWPTLLQRLDRLYTRMDHVNPALTPQCWLAVNDVLLRLKHEARLPVTAQGFCDILSPLLCTSQAQQARFAPVFYAWLRSTLLLAQDALQPMADKEPFKQRELEPWHNRAWQQFYLHRYRWFAMTLLVLSVSLGAWPQLQTLSVKNVSPDVTTPLASIKPKISSDLIDSRGEGEVTDTPLKPCTVTPLQQCWSAQTPWDSLTQPVFWLLVLSPLVGLWLTRQFLQAQQRLDRARFPRPEQPLHYLRLNRFPQLPFTQLAEHWPQQEQTLVDTAILHERKTIDKTLQHLERLEWQAVYRQRREEPSYLVLVDRPHAADHSSVLADQLLAALKSLSVDVIVYDYLDDPRWCYPHDSQFQDSSTVVGLEALQQRYPDARLLLLGQGRGLFHELSGRLYPWTDIFQHWAIRICLVHQAQPWGAKQQALSQQGFLLAPLSSQGVTTLLGWLQQQAQRGIAVPHEGYWFGGLQPQHFPELLSHESWFSERRPRTWREKRRFRQLIQQLQTYLSSDAWLLFSACAAYPEINGCLTLALEAHLFPQASSPEREQRLLKLSNLPWMQQGHMPKYVRVYVLDSLSASDFQGISKALNALIAWSATQKGDLVLDCPITSAPNTALQPGWQGRWAELRNIWQHLRRKPETQAAQAASMDDDKAIDLLLLKTLRGRPHSRLNFIPEVLAHNFRQYSVWWSPLLKQGVLTGLVMFSVMALYPAVMMKVIEPSALKIPITQMVKIPAGTFTMGCLSNDADCRYNEKPAHEVNISGFEISATEVTFAQYDYYCEQTDQNKPTDEGWGRGERPVMNVSWEEAQAYIQWLNQATGKRYRLPTEAEWEYAARAGSSTKYSWGDKPSGEYANGSQKVFRGEEVWPEDGFENTAPVGNYKPNAWGLYDMHGNVFEWVQDVYDEGYYQNSPTSNPQGPAEGSSPYRVLRGGSWYYDAPVLRSADRVRDPPDGRNVNTGFRLSLGE